MGVWYHTVARPSDLSLAEWVSVGRGEAEPERGTSPSARLGPEIWVVSSAITGKAEDAYPKTKCTAPGPQHQQAFRHSRIAL
jgi:hypothetical protein